MAKTKKEILIIDNFSQGITADPTAESGFAMMYCCDIHGKPGTIRIQQKSTDNSDDDSAIDDEVKWLENYFDSGTHYPMAVQNDGKIFYLNTGVGPNLWTQVRNPGLGGQGAKAFGASFYYVQNSQLGQLQGDPTVPGNYTDNFQALKTAMIVNEYSQCVIFAGALYVPNERYIGKLEADEVTWDNEALTLPLGYYIRGMCEWNDRLVFGTFFPGSTKQTPPDLTESIFIWDGVSPTFEKRIPVPGAVTAVFNYNDVLFAFIDG